MVVELPFFRYGYQPDRFRRGRGFFYMVPVHGPRVVVIEAFRRRNGTCFYKTCGRFVRDYGRSLGISGNLIWNSKPDLKDWLDGVVHNSFLRRSVPGVVHCWYYKHITAADLHGPLVLPDGFARDFESTDTSIWILIKHGPSMWPIRILDNVMQNGWVKFRNVHEMKLNYKLILVCERKWIFTAIILDQNGKQVWSNWAEIVNPYCTASYVPRGNLQTSLTLSEMEEEYPYANTGYQYNHALDHQEEFERRIELPLYDRGTREVIIWMKNRGWTIPLSNHHLQTEAFHDFVADLQLKQDDYIFISVSLTRQVHVVVFDAWQRKERLYDWF